MSAANSLRVVVAPLPRTPERGRERVALQSEHARRAARLAAESHSAPSPRFLKDANDVPLPSDGWSWSVSHTTNYVAGCVHARPVGVDIEALRDARAEIVDRVLSAAELARLGELTPRMFLRAWTAKEAVLKELGVGLGKLSECEITSLPSEREMLVTCGAVERRVQQLVEADYVASACSADDADVLWLAVATPIAEASTENAP